MRVGIIGSGDVGRTLAAGLARHGHDTMLGSRTPQKLMEWGRQNPAVKLGTFDDAAAHGPLVVLAVKGTVALEALRSVPAAHLAGKVVMDTTNPIADAPPVNGVFPFFTCPAGSLMEELQRAQAEARFVKAFNSVGAGMMVDPQLPGGPPTMFICGEDESAKQVVGGIVRELGWEVADMGRIEAARAIEPLCMLWCIPGLSRGQWNHAFRLLHG